MHVDDNSCYHHDENDVGYNLNELNSAIVISLVLPKYSGDSLLIKRMLTLKVVQALLSPSMPFLEFEFCNLSFFSLSFIYYPLTHHLPATHACFQGGKPKSFTLIFKIVDITILVKSSEVYNGKVCVYTSAVASKQPGVCCRRCGT